MINFIYYFYICLPRFILTLKVVILVKAYLIKLLKRRIKSIKIFIINSNVLSKLNPDMFKSINSLLITSINIVSRLNQKNKIISKGNHFLVMQKLILLFFNYSIQNNLKLLSQLLEFLMVKK